MENQIVQPPASNQQLAPAEPPKNRKTMKILVIIAGVIVIIIIIAVSVGLLATEAPTKVANQFVQDLIAGNVSQAYQVTSSQFQSQYSQAQFEQMLKQQQDSISQITKTTFNNRTRQNSQAVIAGTVSNNNNQSVPVEIDLTNENSNWKVSGFDFKFNQAQ